MGVPIQVWRARIGGFSPNKQASHSTKFGARGSHGRTIFRGGGGGRYIGDDCLLLCACAMLLLASGIEPNPGANTPRVGVPMLGGICGSARSMDLDAQYKDPYFAQRNPWIAQGSCLRDLWILRILQIITLKQSIVGADIYMD